MMADWSKIDKNSKKTLDKGDTPNTNGYGKTEPTKVMQVRKSDYDEIWKLRFETHKSMVDILHDLFQRGLKAYKQDQNK